MASRTPPNDGSPPRYSQDAPPVNRWNAPPVPDHHHSSHDGPPRRPYDPRSGLERADWATRTSQYPGMIDPPTAWPGQGGDQTAPTVTFPSAYPPGHPSIIAASAYAYGSNQPTPPPPHLMTAPTSSVLGRRSSDERWQRYESGSTMSPAEASTFRAPLTREPPLLREAALVPSPLEAHPSPSAAAAAATTNADPDPPRARVACTFCRVRKLRCDGAIPCRHCERRNIDCVYAPTKTKAKPSVHAPSVAGKSSKNSASASSIKQIRLESEGRDRGTKRIESPNQLDDPTRSSNTDSASPGESSKRIKSANGSSRRPKSGDPSEYRAASSSAPSSSMPGSDLAMIQNNDSPIPMEPTFGDHDDWWNHLLGIFGRSRSTSTRIVQHLLTRFVQSNAVFFGLLHAPTLLAVVSGKQGRMRADPALYLAVLAVSACDMHQTRIADERTSDMTSANEASRQLAAKLSEMAASYLQTSTAHGSALTPSMGQAASILALTQPDGSTEQNSLIRLAENVVRTLKLHETVSSREPLLQDSEPDSPLYWSRPVTSDSPESEVKYESIVRLCWTGISHRFRRYIAKPDEDFGEIDLPEFIQEVRPMAFWQPSLLPEDLPPPFFHSQDLMRRSAHLSRLTVSLAKLEKIREVDEAGTPPSDLLEQVRGILRSLDDLETSFVRHRPRSDAERHNVLGRTLQMFCRMHVWVRLTIWRKYKLWNSASDARSNDAGGNGADRLFQTTHHPTVEFWLTIVQEMIDTMQQDLDAHVVDMTALRTSASDVNTLARHVICACDLVVASGEAQPITGQVDVALNILKRMLAHASLNEAKDGLHLTEDVVQRVKLGEMRRAELIVGNAAATGQLEMTVADADTVRDDPMPSADELAKEAAKTTDLIAEPISTEELPSQT